MKDEIKTTRQNILSENFASSARRIVTIDVEKYQTYLDGMDINDERKEEFLRSMLSMILAFVDLGFSVHPVQEVCGKDKIGANQRPEGAVDGVLSNEPKQHATTRKPSPSGGLEAK